MLGELDGRAVSLSALERADATWEELPHHGVPGLSSWVLVLGEDLHHAPLSEVEVGRQVAFEGRVFDILGLEQVSAVRPTGQVVARVVDTFARLAPEVLEATIALEDGTTELLTGTPEHPVHLADADRYAPLRELRPGDRLTTRDGTEAVLQQVERRYGDIEVFNVEVAGQHNYLADDLLVHNAPSRAVCKKLGSLLDQADECVRDVLRARGGGGRLAREIGQPWIEMKLLAVAKAAVGGDDDANKAIKIVKDAKRLQAKCRR